MLTTESAARKDRTSGNVAKLEHRHFAFIAATIQDMELSREAKWRMIDAFADACAATNPRFDRNRFLTACGAVRT